MSSSRESSSSILAFVTRWSYSRRTTCVIWSSSFGTQWIFFFVSFTLPPGFKRPAISSTLPSFGSRTTLTTKTLPQCRRVTSSPSSMAAASSCSSHTSWDCKTRRRPSSSFLGCLLSSFPTGSVGPSSLSSTAPAFATAMERGTIGSIFCLFMAQILSHSMRFVAFDIPWVSTKSRKPSTVMPRRMTPCTVGNLGSFQPSTHPLSTNRVSLRFDSMVWENCVLENSTSSTFLEPVASNTHSYMASRSLYSMVRSACVTPSMASTTGHAKSYVGYAL
mmetsp:Transcript_124681/g.364156  ORF Transcript_124681/g.364156 Transcript_124681/m.364156 type:complete len:276 (-) Transcript_124681:929-1756(-)